MTNPLVVLPRGLVRAVVRRDPTLLDDTILCLVPYALLATLGCLGYSASVRVGFSEGILESVSRWSTHITFFVLSAWLAVPTVFSIQARTGVLRRRQVVRSTLILFAALFVSLATPLFCERVVGSKLAGSLQTGELRELLKSYLSSTMFSVEHAGFQMPFWNEAAKDLGVQLAVPAKDYPKFTPELVDQLAQDVCKFRDLLKMFDPQYYTWRNTVWTGSGIHMTERSAAPPEGRGCPGWLSSRAVQVQDQGQQHDAIHVLQAISFGTGRILGHIFILGDSSAWKSRSRCGWVWFFPLGLSAFWTACIRFGGDLARKGILVGLVPYWYGLLIESLGEELSEKDSFLLWGFLLLLLVIYVRATGPRQPFAAFKWVQYGTPTLVAASVVVSSRYLTAPEIISPADQSRLFHWYSISACTAIVALIATQLLAPRIASLAVSPVRK